MQSSRGGLPCSSRQAAPDSALRRLYDAEAVCGLLCAVPGEDQLHAYADPLSSVRLHDVRPGQAPGRHFDNSTFAITLMVQGPEAGWFRDL